MPLPKPVCIVCNKTPEELDEYINAAKCEGITPTEYVRIDEGTYNSRNGHFYCTSCYFDIGMPLGVAP